MFFWLAVSCRRILVMGGLLYLPSCTLIPGMGVAAGENDGEPFSAIMFDVQAVPTVEVSADESFRIKREAFQQGYAAGSATRILERPEETPPVLGSPAKPRPQTLEALAARVSKLERRATPLPPGEVPPGPDDPGRLLGLTVAEWTLLLGPVGGLLAIVFGRKWYMDRQKPSSTETPA